MPRDDAASWMWPEACAMVARTERLHRQFFHVVLSPGWQSVWQPPADMVETSASFCIVVAMPGVDPETIGVKIENDRLAVSGTRSFPDSFSGGAIHRLELPYGRFERILALPPGAYGDVKSEFTNGCLHVTLTKI
jgi:HSP20 family protein